MNRENDPLPGDLDSRQAIRERDAGLRLSKGLNRSLAVGSLLAAGLFSELAASGFGGHGSTHTSSAGARTGTATTVTAPTRTAASTGARTSATRTKASDSASSSSLSGSAAPSASSSSSGSAVSSGGS